MIKFFSIPTILWIVLCSCNQSINVETNEYEPLGDEIENSFTDSIVNKSNPELTNDTLKKSESPQLHSLNPTNLINYAQSLIGIPYKYGSTDADVGFDCSGFITNVFANFNKKVPRSSVDFTNYGVQINISESKPGDLILFTGTDSTKRIVGHMGILTQTVDTIKFIHSTSGKAYGVTVTPLNKYYQGRYVKIIRVLDY